jgi:hypothetical protein
LNLLFLPIFLGHPKARASAPKASGCILGGTHGVWRGTEKAEDVKLPGAGISLKQCPRKWEAGKGVTSAKGTEDMEGGPQHFPNSSKFGNERLAHCHSQKQL